MMQLGSAEPLASVAKDFDDDSGRAVVHQGRQKGPSMVVVIGGPAMTAR
jgi:hypothetical protein